MTAVDVAVFFDRVADDLDAVPRLRCFILGLAVRGKLVEQNPNDEPASTAVQRLKTEKSRLTADGLLRWKSLQPLAPSETPFEVPSTWAWVRVGDCFLYDAGTKVEPDALKPDRWLLELEDVEKDTGVLLAHVTVHERAPRSTKSSFEEGDILYGKLRPYLSKVLVAPEPGYSTTEIVAIRPLASMSSSYCALALRRPDFVEYVTMLGRGTKMPRLRRDDAVAAPFPLPPLAEQHRIAAKVDELMALCDELEAAQTERESRRDRLVMASLARLTRADDEAGEPTFRQHARFYLNHLPPLTTRPDHVAALRRTILDLAVRGKLEMQSDADEPAAKALKAIQGSKEYLVRLGQSTTTSVPLSIESDALPFEAPSGWAWARLADVCRRIHYGYTASADFSIREVRLLRITDIQNDSVDWVTVPGCAIPEREVAKYRLEPGDIVIARTGGTIGKSYLVRELPVTAVFASYLIRIQGMPEIDARYMKLLLDSPLYWDQLQEGARGSGQPNVNGQTLGRIMVIVPPFDEQRRIVKKVDQLMALCAELEDQLNVARTSQRALLEAMLHQALVTSPN